MATISEIQTALGNTGRNARIVRTIMGTTAGKDRHYVIGGIWHIGMDRWITTNQSDNAATQAAAIVAALIA